MQIIAHFIEMVDFWRRTSRTKVNTAFAEDWTLSFILAGKAAHYNDTANHGKVYVTGF